MRVFELIASIFGVPVFSVVGIIILIVVLSPLIVIALLVIAGILKIFIFLLEKLGVYFFILPFILLWIGMAGYMYLEPKINNSESECRSGDFVGYLYEGEYLYFDTRKEDFNYQSKDPGLNSVTLFCREEDAIDSGYQKGY